MKTLSTRFERSVLATAAVLVSAFGISSLAQSFLPADPHAGFARQQELLQRVEQVRGVQRDQQDRIEQRPVAATISSKTIL